MSATPTVIRPEARAVFSPDRMGKSTLYASPHVLVGVNAFEPGQSHALHAHAGMDKVYHVLAGEGQFLLEDAALPMRAGDLLIAPADVPHGVHNTSTQPLIVLAILAPGPR
jgi:quercetin dioxygenase-like cupin family protein